MKRISTFDDWIDLFHEWQEDVEVERSLMGDYQFETKFGELPEAEIEFGSFAGGRKWEKLNEIPDQRIKDGLLRLITVQGDTEFASVEQQRHLFKTAPSEYDLQGLARIQREEARHGWQMCYLLVDQFGSSGAIEAQKLLERRAFQGTRILGSFNAKVANWLDFFSYTEFIDRDGKYQLVMLKHSAFAPLARSTVAMLREEAHHMATGHDGLKRTIRHGKIPTEIIQRRFNHWISTAYDLFGNDESTSAEWAYVWGLKGRFDQGENDREVATGHLNEYNRDLYYHEAAGLVDLLNQEIPPGSPRLYVPDQRFRRSIGHFAGQRFSVHGEPLSPAEYERHLAEVLPRPEDDAFLDQIMREGDWITPRKATIVQR